jgi:biopolymer transport protein ExbB
MFANILLVAQNVAAGNPQDIIETAKGAEISFLSLLLKGGYILFPILILSFISIFLIVKKSIELNESLKVDRGMLDIFYSFLRKGDLEAASMHLMSQHNSYSRIYQKVIRKIGKPIKEIENAIESSSSIEVAKINKGLGYLGLIAGIAPMLGFIGTISGIIKIFYNISLTDNISIGIISGGLYEKMISSGSGLIVGVIAFTGYHMLNMRITRFIAKVEEESFEFLDILSK